MPHLVTRAGVKQEDELYALFACRSVTRLVTRLPCPGMGGQLVMKEPSLLFGSLQLKIPLGMAVSESGRTLDYTVEPLTCNCLHFSRATSGGCTGRSSNIAVLPVRFEWAREVEKYE